MLKIIKCLHSLTENLQDVMILHIIFIVETDRRMQRCSRKTGCVFFCFMNRTQVFVQNNILRKVSEYETSRIGSGGQDNTKYITERSEKAIEGNCRVGVSVYACCLCKN